jgi:hypothetical protein
VTDGLVEATTANKTHGSEPTPPASPAASSSDDNPIPSTGNITLEIATGKHWTPYYLNTLPPLNSKTSNKIPNMTEMQSFSPDFLRNTFGGIQWSPGLNFIPPVVSGPCLLRNRSYYTLDFQFEPYLPSQPGGHGAKIVPFFNENAEDHYDLPEECGTTSENVPLFVMRKDAAGRLRYFYFGHYSQTRWSDKLDYDRMVQCIPAKVREYWAEELSSAGRPEWITDALLKHFFPKPEYNGRLFGVPVDEGGSIVSEDMNKCEEKMFKDVKKYVQELKEWQKDARMKTAMIKKEFILQAFDRVSGLVVLLSRNNGVPLLTAIRLMQMTPKPSAFGGSISSALTGKPTSTTCSSGYRLGIPAMSATKITFFVSVYYPRTPLGLTFGCTVVLMG